MINNYQTEIDSISLAPPKLSVEKFDSMVDFIIEKQNLGFWGSIIQCIKLLCVIGFVIAREALVRSAIAEKKKQIDILVRLRNQNSNEVND